MAESFFVGGRFTRLISRAYVPPVSGAWSPIVRPPMLTHASLRTLVSASRFFSAAALSLGLATTSLALPTDPALSLDAAYGLFPRPAGHQYFPSPQDWRDVNIYQLFTDRFADGDACAGDQNRVTKAAM